MHTIYIYKHSFVIYFNSFKYCPLPAWDGSADRTPGRLQARPIASSGRGRPRGPTLQRPVALQGLRPRQNLDPGFKPPGRMVVQGGHDQRDLGEARAEGLRGFWIDQSMAGFAFHGQKRPMAAHDQ